jgi:integration host factor subunit alpha
MMMNRDESDFVSEILDDLMARSEGGFTLTKAELSEVLFAQVGLNKREAKEMVEAFFEEICAALEQGELAKLSGFGNFSVRDKASRPGRNPKTGELVPIAARRVVNFHASQKLKEMVALGDDVTTKPKPRTRSA